MMTCKQIQKALANGDYSDLSPLQRMLLKFHVTICFICGGYNREIMLFQDTARAYREREDSLAAEKKLPDDAREKMHNAIRSARRIS